MGLALTPNLDGITNNKERQAYLDGLVSGNVDLSWLMIFPWDGSEFIADGVAPPSGYSSTNVVEGSEYATEAVEKTYSTTIRMIEARMGYALSGPVARTMAEFLKLELFRQLGALGLRYFAQLAAGLLNACTTTNLSDGVPLGSASHPSAAGLQSNYINSSLGFTAYASAVRAMRDMVNHRGTLMAAEPTRLVFPSALDVTAGQVLGSQYAANDLSQINVNGNSGVAPVRLPELTSATRWFLLDSSRPFMIPVLKGQTPKVQESGSRENDDNYVVRDGIWAGAGIKTWRGVMVG
jgi:hypothetical protein